MKTILRQAILPATMGILSVMGTLVAQAANDTWSGGANPNFNWNVSGNWNTLPSSGDNLFFAGSTGLSNTNNFSSYSFNGVTFSSGAGSFVLNGNSFSLNGGITNSAVNPQLISNAVALTASGTISANSGNVTNAGVISGTGYSLIKNGAALLNLQGANTFSGCFSNYQGTVQVSAIGLAGTAGPLGAALNGSAVSAASACPINFIGNNSMTLQYTGPGETSDRSIFINTQIGKPPIAIDASGAGALVFKSGVTNVFVYVNNASAGNVPLYLTGTSTSLNTLAGDIIDNLKSTGNSDTASIYKTGVGTWCLTGVNHLHGLVWAQNGTLMFNTISNAGTACALGLASSVNNSGIINAQIALGNGATLGILQYTGAATNSTTRQFGLYGNGTISAGTNGGCLLLNGSITNLTTSPYTLTLAGGGTNLLGGIISDNVGVATTSLIVSNVGIWALTNANTFSGSTEPAVGELLLGNSAALQNSVLDLEGGDTGIVSFGTLTSVTLGGLESISGTRNLNVTNNAGAALPLTLTKNDGNTYNYPGTLQGGTTLTKTGNASQSLGALNFSGATIINAGTLTIQSGGSISSPQIAVASGATLDVSQLSGLTLNAGNVLSGAGQVNGNVTASSKSTISLSTPSSGAVTLNITGNLTLNGGATNYLNLGSSTSASVNDVLTVNGSLTLSGLNTLVLNPYLGSLANGTYPLIEYQYGSLSGSLANLTVPAIPGYSLTLTNDTVDSPNVISVIVQAAHIPASLVWKGNGSNNNWDIQTTADWLNGASLVDFYNNDSVTLNDSSTNPTVNLAGSLVPAAIEVNNSLNNYTLTGSGLIIGPTALTKDGTGTLTLLTANSFSGGMTIDTGTVQVGNGGASGWLGSGPITNNGALIVDLSSQNSLPVLAGAGSLTQAGSGLLTLTNDTSDFSGNVTVNNGTLAVTSESGLGTGTQVTLGSGGVIQTLETSPDSFYRSAVLNAGGGGFNHAIDLTLDASQLGNITGTGPLILEGTGQSIIQGAETYSGGTMLKGGSLAIDNVSSLGTNALTVTGGTLFRANGGEQLTMTIPVNLATNLILGNPSDQGLTFTNGPWSLQGPAGTNLQLTVNAPVEIDSVIGQSSLGISLTKSGANTLLLTGSNTFSGVFGNLQGTVQVTAIGLAGTPGPLGAAPNGITTGNEAGITNSCPIALVGPNSPTLQYIGPGETTDRSIFINAQNGKTVTLDASGSGPLVFMSGLTNVFAYIGNATPGDDILNLAGSNPGLNTLAGDMIDSIYNGNDGMAIYKTGPGTWFLQGPKHQKGLVSVINGVLMFDSIANIGTACSLGTAAAVYNGTTALSYQISLGTNNTSGTLQYNGTNLNSTTRSIALNGNGTISAGTNGGSLALNGSIANATTKAYALTFADGGNNTMGGIISDGAGGGQTSIIVSDTGSWSFTAANTYSGTTTVNTGTLNVSSAQTGTNTITVNDSATFGVTVSGTNQLSPAMLTLGASSGATNSFSGLSSTTIAPINTSALVLNGNIAISLPDAWGAYVAGNTYPLITCGSISGGGSLALGSKPSGLVATLVTLGSGPFTIALSVTSFSPDIWAAGNGNWDTSSPNWNIPIYANGDPVVFNDTASGAGPFTVTVTPVTVSPGGILVSNNTKNYTIGGNPIVGTASLIKNGTGTATLAGANTFSGGTTINAGTLALSGAGTLGGGAMNLVLSGGTLDLGGLATPAAGAVSITSPASSGNTIQNGSLTASSYACSAASTIVSAIVSANLLGASATLTKTNAGTLILTGANAFGAATLGGGTLQIGNGGTTGTLGTGTVTVTGSSGTTTVSFNRTDPVSSPYYVSNSIVGGSGTHAFIVAYSGAVSLGGSNDNSEAGVDVKNGATLILAKVSSVTPSVHAFGVSSTVESGGTMQLAGTGGAEIYSNLTLTVQSGGVFDLNSQSNLFNTLDLAGTGISAGGALINSASGTTSILAANVNLTANSSMGGVGNLSIPNVISGSGFGLTKVGGGTATLSGANTYTGNTTVNAGTLEIVNPVIATNSTVTVASGAVLKLDFAVTNTVTALVLNGASQSAGVYNSSTGSPFITGSGSLLVAASSGPGTFTNPTGITGFSLSGLNVVITATNGQAGDAYYLLESTNLALPITQWTVVATNVLGTAGNYTFNATNVVMPGAAQQFYRLSNTNN